MDHTSTPKPIDEISTEQLQAELKRREQKKPMMPGPLPHPNFDLLRKEVTAYLRMLTSDDYSEDVGQRAANSICETAIDAYYGQDVWKNYIIPSMKWQGENKDIDEEIEDDNLELDDYLEKKNAAKTVAKKETPDEG
jgi:hypothetical protein